jgi:hypothetical protein
MDDFDADFRRRQDDALIAELRGAAGVYDRIPAELAARTRALFAERRRPSSPDVGRTVRRDLPSRRRDS